MAGQRLSVSVTWATPGHMVFACLLACLLRLLLCLALHHHLLLPSTLCNWFFSRCPTHPCMDFGKYQIYSTEFQCDRCRGDDPWLGCHGNPLLALLACLIAATNGTYPPHNQVIEKLIWDSWAGNALLFNEPWTCLRQKIKSQRCASQNRLSDSSIRTISECLEINKSGSQLAQVAVHYLLEFYHKIQEYIENPFSNRFV